MMKTAIGVGAHPDDIGSYKAGALVLVKQVGWQVHYLNVASGNCGSLRWNASRTRAIRRREARHAAGMLGAHWHPPLGDDLEIFYEINLLRRLAALIREIKPTIVLTHSPQDYMEDHTNTCRLAVTAAFAHALPNFRSVPPRPIAEYDLTVYHAMPHSLRDPLRRLVAPGAFVNTASVQDLKRAALAGHKSQQNWLELSQGMNSYLLAMEKFSRAVGSMSEKFTHAEGWRPHLHYGFSATEVDPLQDALGESCLVNQAYERGLSVHALSS